MSSFAELVYAQAILKAGFSPFWNPWLSCGVPLFAQPGLAMGYPGILTVLLFPRKIGVSFFLITHFFIAFFGALYFSRKLGSKGYSIPVAGLFACSCLYLGVKFAPSLTAGMAWAPWVALAEGEKLCFISWAMLLSCADPSAAAVGFLLRRIGLGKSSHYRSLLAAMVASSFVWVPTLQAVWKTRAVQPGFPILNVEESAKIKAKARDNRVFFEPKNFSAVSVSPVQGLFWTGGSRRPVAWVADRLGALAGPGLDRDDQLSLQGTSMILSGDGASLVQSKHSAPFRAAFVSSAGFVSSPNDLEKIQGKSFLTRPLLLNEFSPSADSWDSAVAWTMLSMDANALGEFSSALPEKHLDGWFYVSDAYYPGWKASVDGSSQPILRAEGSFRAVRVKSTSKMVSFAYRPWPTYFAWAISLAMLFVAFGRVAIFAGID